MATRSGWRGGLAGAALLVVGILGAGGCAMAQPPGGETPPALVETVPVVRDRVYEEVRLTGTILPRRYTMVMGEVSGIVEQMHVDDGDFVQAGQPLVTLRSAPARCELEAARADLAQLVAELEELENGERPEVSRAREAELRDAKGRLVPAEEEEQRVRELLDSGSTSQSTYDTRRAELE